MSEVEVVALWAGLISSVVSCVLSVVAIIFAIVVDRSARAVTAQTIKSLQKIESDVERLSTDTRELIKAGWEKMLGNFGMQSSPAVPLDDPAAKDVAAGIASELRAEIAALPDKLQTTQLNDLVHKLQATVEAQLRLQPESDSPAVSVEQAYRRIAGLPSQTQALVTLIAPKHLTRDQYAQLSKGPLHGAVISLRKAGLLMPVEAADDTSPVYYYPPRLARAIRAVIPMLPPASADDSALVKQELQRVGYYSETAGA